MTPETTPSVRVHSERGLMIALYTDHEHAWCVGLEEGEYRLVNIPKDEYEKACSPSLTVPAAANIILHAAEPRTAGARGALEALRCEC